MKTGGERAFIVFSWCFLFSCLGCGIGWLSGHGGLGQTSLPDWKEENQ